METLTKCDKFIDYSCTNTDNITTIKFVVSNQKDDEYLNNINFHDDTVYEWSSETQKYLSEMKNNSTKKFGLTLVKYFAQFSKSQNK